jgi:osmotically-inducible protein OsmY
MSGARRILVGATCLVASAWLSGCNRPPEASPRGRQVGDDLQGVAEATERTAKDIGHATVDLADKAGRGLEDVTAKAGVKGQDSWITTKVKTDLASAGFDPLRVHVDTDQKVVTLSGTVESSTKAKRAVSVAKAVAGVGGVKDHLFVNRSPP